MPTKPSNMISPNNNPYTQFYLFLINTQFVAVPKRNSAQIGKSHVDFKKLNQQIKFLLSYSTIPT